MANHIIPEDPQYNNALRKLEETDLAHPDTFNPLYARLLENEEYLYRHGQEIEDTIMNRVTDTLGALATSMTDLTFQLALQDLVNTDGMANIAVDVIDSAESVKIISGIFEANKVYI